MVRIAGLRRQVAAGVVADAARRPHAARAARRDRRRGARGSPTLQRNASTACCSTSSPTHGVRLLAVRDLTPGEWGAIDEYFESQIFPVLTPLAVDPGHPFPYISNLSLSLAVEIRDPERGAMHFARVKVPKSLPRWVPVPGRPHHFVPLEQVIGANLGALFPGMEVVALVRLPDHALLRPRDSGRGAGGPARDDRGAGVQAAVRRGGARRGAGRHAGAPARAAARRAARRRRAGGRPLAERDIQDAGTLLDLGDLMALDALDLPGAQGPAVRADRCRPSCAIADRTHLRHHPRAATARAPSVRLVLRRRSSAFSRRRRSDDQVLAIKLTLYRTSGDTAIVAALIEAAQRGKQVAVLVELKARFDEANNITWARQLEDAGVHVAFGSASLKTHAKTALVVRREADGIRRYVHSAPATTTRDGAAVHRRRPVHLQPVDRRRRQRPVQLAHRLLAPAPVSQAARRAGRTCAAASSS